VANTFAYNLDIRFEGMMGVGGEGGLRSWRRRRPFRLNFLVKRHGIGI